jgi:hypothetical protein
METKFKINVAPSSTEGHFVKGSKNVIQMDDVTETFFIEGKSELVTKNHTTLKQEEDCLIISQQVYNPYTRKFELAID